ncbi:MAG: DNA-directed RNA polymerase subunit omega [Actinomycetota bacterium]
MSTRSYDTMINPPIEDLLDCVDSKFSLVTLAARRARDITTYERELRDGSGVMVPVQVPTLANKPLSKAFDEIAAHKIVRAEHVHADDDPVA